MAGGPEEADVVVKKYAISQQMVLHTLTIKTLNY